MPLIQGKSNKARSENIKREIQAGRDPKQAAAIAYATQRKAKSKDRGGSLMGAPRDPSNGEGRNPPASAGDPSRVPGDASFVPGAVSHRQPTQMGSPFDPRDSSYLPGFSGSPPSRSPSVMGAPIDPDDRTSSLDAAMMGGRAAIEHFASARSMSRDAREVMPPMGMSARRMPGGQGGQG